MNPFAKTFSFVVVAGGSGTRMAGNTPKQFLPVNGRPLWRWGAETAANMPAQVGANGICEVVLVLPKGDATPQAWDFVDSVPLRLAEGGGSRPESVLNGLLASSCDFVMVHDAARPFASQALLRRLMEATSESIGAVPVLPVADALKRVTGNQVEAVDREGLYLTQTPQSFYRPTLIEALMAHGDGAKDEGEAWLASGRELACVEGERLNFKVTWPEDLRMARALAGGCVRAGMGYDVHRLVPERPLILGGVRIENSPLGLLGHSDADLLAHAVADAVLGAAGLPDIGNLFPASDERYRGANSMELLRDAVGRARRDGWRVGWVDAVIQAQVPKLNPHLAAMRENLSSVLNPGGPNCVNLKAKSAEGTGDAGGAGAMTCWATATLYLETR